MIDATKDEEELHGEAEELRRQTAKGAPEVAEHDHVADLEKQLEEARSNALYAAAETQNVRRRLEQELQQATSYASAGFARDMLAIKDHLDRALAAVGAELRAHKTASQFLAGIETTPRAADAGFLRRGVTPIQAGGGGRDPPPHPAR